MRLSSLIVAAAAGLSTVAKVVVYDLHLTEGVRGPDGFKRDVLLINGKTPGPEIVADQWDEISVRIKNDLSVETTLHVRFQCHPTPSVGTNPTIPVPWSRAKRLYLV